MYNYPNYNYGYMPQQQMAQNYQPQIPTINGKTVDSIDVARAYDLPIGSYAVLPKADLSEVYIKSWNPDATTKIETYQKVVSKENPNSIDATLENVVQMLNDLSDKVDLLQKPNNQNRNKKEVNQNE